MAGLSCWEATTSHGWYACPIYLGPVTSWLPLFHLPSGKRVDNEEAKPAEVRRKEGRRNAPEEVGETGGSCIIINENPTTRAYVSLGHRYSSVRLVRLFPMGVFGSLC